MTSPGKRNIKAAHARRKATQDGYHFEISEFTSGMNTKPYLCLFDIILDFCQE